MSDVIIEGLRVNYLTNPIGIGLEAPRFSWRMVCDRIGAAQLAYQLQVAVDADYAALVWDSGWVESHASTQVLYAGEPIRSKTRYTWRVRVRDEHGEASRWSESAYWETTLAKSDWQARWIEPEDAVDPEAFKPAPYLRKEFALDKDIASARLYITSHGLYEATLNGKRIGDQVFMPGNTSYIHRVQVQAYDVKELLLSGGNCLGVILGDGWFRGSINAISTRNSHGEKVALLAQLEITYSDGSQSVVCTDGSWKTSPGPILKSDMKDGEIYDARLEMPGWDSAGFDDSRWQAVHEAQIRFDKLVASEGSPIRKMEAFPVREVIQTPSGQMVLDFGQNLAGIVSMRVSGPAGITVKIQHSETLDQDGNFSLDYLAPGTNGGVIKGLLQRNEYTLKGEGIETYEPHFTVAGFRYAWVEGYPGEIDPAAFTAHAIYSDMGENGSFTCSNEKLNQLHRNVLWSQKGNFLDIPTDCPTRERAGWTGDAQIFVHAGSLLMDDAAFYAKWIKDVAAEQFPNGLIRNFVPAAPPEKSPKLMNLIEGSSGWGDAIVIIPWTLYQMFGDRKILEDTYESMKAWVEYERRHARRTHWVKWINPLFWFDFKRHKHQRFIWDTKYHWGEWLEPDIPISKVFSEIIKHIIFGDPIVSSAYFTYSARLLSQAASVLGKNEDAKAYAALADSAKKAYSKEFIKPDGTLKQYSEKQAPYVRVLALDLADESLVANIQQKLVERVEATGCHLGTGFLSTPFLCNVLSEMGRADLAYAVLLQEGVPSWLYAINHGATTIWEDWDGVREDGTVSASLNHYSKGAVVSWFYEYMCGIQMDENSPAYHHFFLKPQPGGGLTNASAGFTSMYGRIESSWEIKDSATIYSFTVPANSSATVELPGNAACEGVAGVSDVQYAKGKTVFNLASGKYIFTCR